MGAEFFCQALMLQSECTGMVTGRNFLMNLVQTATVLAAITALCNDGSILFSHALGHAIVLTAQSRLCDVPFFCWRSSPSDWRCSSVCMDGGRGRLRPGSPAPPNISWISSSVDTDLSDA